MSHRDVFETIGGLSGLVLAASLAVATAGCGGSYARGSASPDLDEMTMSLRFDRKDLETLYRKNVDKLMNSKIVDTWKTKARSGSAPVVAVFPIENDSSEHIRQPLDALLSKFQTDLVNKLPVDVVSRTMQSTLIQEVKRQQGGAYHPNKLAEYGKQLGAQYYLTGRVYDVAERTEQARRVQYFLFIQVLNVETGAIEFKTESSLTKALLG